MPTPPVSPIERFHQKYEVAPNGCWEWTASLSRYGYGQLRTGTVKEGGRTMTKAHRFSWELHNGPIPKGLAVCHKCDNRKCVNPEHLFLGTNADNTADMMAKGRGARGERHGNHKLTDDDVVRIRALAGSMLQREIAARFGVNQQTVSKILNGSRRLTDPDPDLASYQSRYRRAA